MCKIQNCTKCGNIPHQQDTIYGKGLRLFNPDKNGNYPVDQCTVCGSGKRKIIRLWGNGQDMPFANFKVQPTHLRNEHCYPHIPVETNLVRSKTS